MIPARGGSKGIPRKNVLPLAGRPLLAHILLQALQARLVNRVIVSTDDAEIAAVTTRYGGEVIWRPPELSGDSASSESALLHALEHLKTTENYQPDILVFLQCTAPLTATADIDGTIQALLDQDAQTALAAVPFHYFLWKPTPDGSAEGINHDKRRRLLRQERPPEYLEAGSVYVMRVPGFLENRHRFFGKTALHIMPLERRLEIDEPVDMQIAEVLLRNQQVENRAARLPETIQAIVFDFDGVFTDNKVVVMEDGREAVVCDRSDGWGLARLRETGLPMLILSTETNPVVTARAGKLRLPCIHGMQKKAPALLEWLQNREIDPRQTIYVGNDINDLGCMELVGCAVAVSDAQPLVLRSADIILTHPGGQGALRELSELITAHLQDSSKTTPREGISDAQNDSDR